MKDKKKLALGLCALAIFITILYLSVLHFSSPRIEKTFPLEVRKVEYRFPSLNVTFLATEDVPEPIVGFEIYYESYKIGGTEHKPFTLYKGDKYSPQITISEEPPTEVTIEIRLLLGDKYYQTFKVEIES